MWYMWNEILDAFDTLMLAIGMLLSDRLGKAALLRMMRRGGYASREIDKALQANLDPDGRIMSHHVEGGRWIKN